MTADLLPFRIPPGSDDALALAYAERHAPSLRYVARWGRWLKWDGGRWKFEDTLHAFDLARAICRETADGMNKPKEAKKIVDARTVAAVERLARADRRLAATVDQWDADPWALNTPGGTVDLRSGLLRDHRQEDYLTKSTMVAPAGECPIWRQFLDRVTASSAELQAFLQRFIGYSLTGSTREHALVFAHGTGGNGKGVFVNTISRLLGDYAVVSPIETFTASAQDRHPADLAMLRGARLVVAQETEVGRRWAESRIKALTGGDPITARFMRQDFFTFTPEFKLFIAGNHRPGLRGVDEAIRRRFHLVPFTITIPAAERDESLPATLEAEWPGILVWAIEGCIAWQDQGLAAPEIVKVATDAYLAGEDARGQWLTECCRLKTGFYTTTAELFRSWSKWAEHAGEFVGSQKQFSHDLQDRGLAPKRQSHTGKMGFDGIMITVSEQPFDSAGEGW